MTCWRICIRCELAKAILPATLKTKRFADSLEDEDLQRSIRLFMLAGATALLFLAGWHHAPKSKPRSELTPTEMRGDQIFQTHSAVFHRPRNGASLAEPGLLGLLQKPYLPSGSPANDLVLVGFSSASHATRPHELTAAQLRGQQIMETHCVGCHYVDSNKTLVGPGLKGLFKKSHLPSGAPATDGYVRSKIVRGGNVMPAFGNTLDAEQMRDLLAYLHTI
jgi:cytochrome c553